MILIVPCFNEARRISKAEFVLHSNLFEEIIFVNDGSTDDTADMLDDIKKEIGIHCHVENLPRNQGKGEAIRHGILYYFDKIAGSKKNQHIGFTDADLSSPLTEVHRLATIQNEVNCDFIQGARVALVGRNIKRSALKHYMGRVSATLISELLDLKVYDTQGGVKVFSTSIARQLFEAPFISRWLFDCELYLRAKELDISVYEEPLKIWIDQTLDSKVRISSYFTALLDLIKIRTHYS